MLRCLFVANKQFVRHHNYSYAFGPSSESFIPLTVSDLLEKNATESGEKIAVISQHQGISKTFKELQQDVSEVNILIFRYSFIERNDFYECSGE
jgi:hypothetical protein